MNAITDFFGGRKMSLALLVLIVGTVAFFLGRLSEAGWLDLIKWDLIVYLGSAVGSDITERFGKQPIPTDPPVA
jgi:hypothetical protein